MQYRISKHPSISEMQAPFENLYAASHRRATWIFMCKGMELLVNYFGPDRKPEDIFRHQVELYKQFLAKERGLNEGSIYRYVKVGSAFYTFLQYHDIVPLGFNPFARPKLPKLVGSDRIELIRE